MPRIRQETNLEEQLKLRSENVVDHHSHYTLRSMTVDCYYISSLNLICVSSNEPTIGNYNLIYPSPLLLGEARREWDDRMKNLGWSNELTESSFIYEYRPNKDQDGSIKTYEHLHDIPHGTDRNKIWSVCFDDDYEDQEQYPDYDGSYIINGFSANTMFFLVTDVAWEHDEGFLTIKAEKI